MLFRSTIKELRDALTVTSVATARHETRLKDHQEWLEANERAYARHREVLAQHEAMMISIDQKLDRLTDLVLKGRGGNGQGGEEGGR